MRSNTVYLTVSFNGADAHAHFDIGEADDHWIADCVYEALNKIKENNKDNVDGPLDE